jgi:hypothetical protein
MQQKIHRVLLRASPYQRTTNQQIEGSTASRLSILPRIESYRPGQAAIRTLS